MKKIFLFTIVLIIFQYNAFGQIKEIIPGKVYAGQGKSSDGAEVFFGIELIEDHNIQKWRCYRDQTRHKKDFYLARAIPGREFMPNVQEITGFSDEEYDKHTKQVQDRFKDKSAEYMIELSSSMGGGLNGFGFSIGGYIAYVSTIPVTGYFNHPADCEKLKDYNEGYKDLVMTVRSVDIPDTPVYNNRGISRSLTSLFRRDCPNVSLGLHSFTGEFFGTHKNKTHLSVSPLPTMYNKLCDAFSEKMLVEESIPAELNHFCGLFGLLDKRCVISIEDLKK